MKQFIIEIHFKADSETLAPQELALLTSILPDILREMQELDTEE